MHATRPLPEEATLRYIIDTKGSTFIVQAFSTGLLSAFAHNPRMAIRDFEGNVEFIQSGAALDNVHLQMKIRSDALEVIDDISEKDRDEIQRRLCDEVFETDRFPEIVYECSRVTASGSGERYWAALNGNLTLHGVTQVVQVNARVAINGDSLRASGDFSVRQSDFGIAPVTAAAGAIRVKDAVKCTFDILTRKQE